MVRSTPPDDRDGGIGDFEAPGVGARGGPLFMPALETGLISVRDFQRSCSTLVSVLMAELDANFPTVSNDDIRVDDLKIVTDAELVDKALAEVLEGRVALGEYSGTEQLRGNDLEMVEDDPRSSSRQGSLSVVASGNDGRLEVGTEGRRAGTSSEVETERENTESGVQPLATCSSALRIGGVPSGDTNVTTLLLEEGTEQESRAIVRVSKEKGKRGRPYDRDKRVAEMTMTGDDKREEALARLKHERDNGRENCGLHSLKVKREREAMGNVPTKALSKYVTSAMKIQAEDNAEQNFEAVQPSEVVLHVEVHHAVRRYVKTQEFMVLGRQMLSTLRDKIYCLTNDLAEKTDLSVPSGYFLIEDLFYNDMRDPNAVDYSASLIAWIEEQKEARAKPRKRKKLFDTHGFPVLRKSIRHSTKLPALRAGHMAETCFLDLTIRIGAPYLYCHQGDCKHTIIFRDLRLIHPDDVQNAALYPVLKFIPKVRYRKCSICDIYRAKKVTYGDSLAPSSPCFFCENCYYLLHYSEEGRLLYNDFQVYDYWHE